MRKDIDFTKMFVKDQEWIDFCLYLIEDYMTGNNIKVAKGLLFDRIKEITEKQD